MPLQSHIHLSGALGDAPENAPNLTWKVTERRLSIRFHGSVDYTRTAYIRPFDPKDSEGNPLVFTDYAYTVRIFDEDPNEANTLLTTLLAMLRKEVYLCDSFHANNGADHTSDIKTVFFENAEDPVAEDPMQRLYEVRIKLLDASRR